MRRASTEALSAPLVGGGENEDGELPDLIEGYSDAEENGRESAPAPAVTLHPETSERSLCV